MDLKGRWRKLTQEPCAALYPAEVEFTEATYVVAKGPDQRFTVWDAGIYRIEDEDLLVISTATDELVPYRFTLEGGRIDLEDEDGCSISYQREDR